MFRNMWWCSSSLVRASRLVVAFLVSMYIRLVNYGPKVAEMIRTSACSAER